MTEWQFWTYGHPATAIAANVCWNRTIAAHVGQGSKLRTAAASTGAERGTAQIDLGERQFLPGHSNQGSDDSGANRKRAGQQGRSYPATWVASIMNMLYRFVATMSCLTKKTGAPTPVLFDVHLL